MTPGRSSPPRPCTIPECNRQHAPAEQLALAASLCGARGAKLTALRQQILALLWESDRPMGAYELIEGLRVKTARPVAPPTIYRGLEFLVAQGLAVKIESRNAYAPCAHPERREDCLFLICRACGATQEVEDPRIMKLLAENAASMGYHGVTRRVVEVQATCGNCAETDTA